MVPARAPEWAYDYMPKRPDGRGWWAISEETVKMAPRPNVVPRPGTEGPCQVRATFSWRTIPKAAIVFTTV